MKRTVYGLHMVAPALHGLSILILIFSSGLRMLDFTLFLFLASLAAGVIVSVSTGGICAADSPRPIATFCATAALSLLTQTVILGFLFGACSAAF